MMKKTITIMALLLLVMSCKKNDDNVSGIIAKKEQRYFNTGNTSVSLYRDGNKLVSHKVNGNLVRDVTYINDKMDKYSTYDENGTLTSQYTFMYDSNGKITSFDQYNEMRPHTYTPKYQTRVLQRSGNTIIIPKEVDSVSHDFEKYIYTFNNNNLLTNFKHYNYLNTLRFNVNFSYDGNDNLVRAQGMTRSYTVQNFDIAYTYDDKKNPFYEMNRKNYMNILIITGKIEWTTYVILLNAHNISKNNATESTIGFSSYEYQGDYPVEFKITDNGSTKSTGKLYYE